VGNQLDTGPQTSAIVGFSEISMRLEHQPLEEYPFSVRALAEALSYGTKGRGGQLRRDQFDHRGWTAAGRPSKYALERSAHCDYGWSTSSSKYTSARPKRSRDVWKAIQANTAHISSRGEQVFATKSSHFVQQDEEGVGVMQVCQLFDEVARPNEAKQSGDGRIQPRSGNSRVRHSFRFAGGALFP
jgi:hypothetical protein